MRRAAMLGLLAAIAIGGCRGNDSASSNAEPELVVFAASSLGPAFERYGEEFEGVDVQFSFAGSDDLAAQIGQGVAPDVFAAANTSLPEELEGEGLLEPPTAFATNRLVIGVPAGSGIDGVSDLEQPGVTVAVGDEEVPVGAYTREVLDALGPGRAAAILDNVASSEPDVAGIVAKLTQGAVDAGFVYRSDVEAASGELEEVALPAAVSPDVAYGIAVTTEAEQPDFAEEFVDGAVDGAGQEILLETGFGPPPGGG